jgi:lipid II:glycine glycyltransferase (peptidoglycan interpeptide bridge formation enzyme)
VPLAGRTLEEVQRGFNQQWRRNVKKAEKSGVKVERGDYWDLGAFHTIYLETAERDHFLPRSLNYFQRMWTVLTAEDPDRMRIYLARHNGELLAAATMIVVGEHVWYSYGASTSRKREVQPNNALQWQMMRDAHELGASVYDLRGITDTLDHDNHLLGLLRFKVGTGGQAVEYLGEWDFPLNRVLHKALDLYMSRR